MSSGKTYDIRHPEMAWLTRTDFLVGVGEIDDNVPAEFDICSLLHVAAIEPLPRPATSDNSAAENGQPPAAP